MKLTTKGRYATRAMLDLALHRDDGAVLVRDIARRQEVSEKYLKQLLAPLKAAGLVRTIRGARGGLTLAKPPSEIKLIEIVQVMEGSMAPVECVDDAQICSRSDSCVTCQVWTDMKEAIDKVLESTNLQDLVGRSRPSPIED
ncbi:MAG: Rrf2 family transcriptional regulator [Dehalococcoidia bacterium]